VNTSTLQLKVLVKDAGSDFIPLQFCTEIAPARSSTLVSTGMFSGKTSLNIKLFDPARSQTGSIVIDAMVIAPMLDHLSIKDRVIFDCQQKINGLDFISVLRLS